MNFVSELAKKLACSSPAQLKGVTFDNIPFLRIPCNTNDKFNPYKVAFGMATVDNDEGKTSAATVLLGIVVVCLMTITVSAVIYTVFYVRRHQNRYRAMQNVHYSVNSQGMTIENSIYRDNPTTMPASTTIP